LEQLSIVYSHSFEELRELPYPFKVILEKTVLLELLELVRCESFGLFKLIGA
jgi:hypothetical protein